jgi:hypothetical protein
MFFWSYFWSYFSPSFGPIFRLCAIFGVEVVFFFRCTYAYVPFMRAILCFSSEMDVGWAARACALVSMVFSLSAMEGVYACRSIKQKKEGRRG